MASTWPAKNNYATGDVLTAANMNGVGDDLNDLYTVAGKAAGVNAIINGDFGIWQRGTSFSCTGPTRVFGADRFSATGNATYSRQTFTAGTAPVAGYEGTYFARWDITSNSQNYDFATKLEDARLFAGQIVTLSFWAKANSATSNVFFPRVVQNFGTGGSPSAAVYTDGAAIALTTSWTRYTTTLSLPSIAGKTFGTNSDSYLGVILQLNTTSTITIDLWGFQLEAGSIASPFQTATGTKQGELAACQRYYFRFGGQSPYNTYGMGIATSTTNLSVNIQHPVTMRVNPTSVDFANLGVYNSGSVLSATNAVLDRGGTFITSLNITSAGMVLNMTYALLANNSTSSYFGLSAEL